MSIKNKVVLHNPTTKKHEPLASGDVLAGSIIQVSTDAGNSLQLGTDGGLKVEAVAQLPDDQVLTGDNSGSVSLTLTPSTQPNGDVNYTIKGEVKIDPAEDNAAVATAAGLYVPTPTVPTVSGKQVEFGTQEATTESHQTHVLTFATAFPTVPFVTLTSSIPEDLLNWQALNITTTGFTLEGISVFTLEGKVFVVPGFAGNVNWKAEEK